MKLSAYTGKQDLLEIYSANLHALEIQIAHAGGETVAPLDKINQRNIALQDIANLEQAMYQMELKMMQEIPTIRDAFIKQETEIKQLQSVSKDKDKSIELLSLAAKELKALVRRCMRLVGSIDKVIDQQGISEFTNVHDILMQREYIRKDSTKLEVYSEYG